MIHGNAVDYSAKRPGINYLMVFGILLFDKNCHISILTQKEPLLPRILTFLHYRYVIRVVWVVLYHHIIYCEQHEDIKVVSVANHLGDYSSPKWLAFVINQNLHIFVLFYVASKASSERKK